MSGVGNYTTEQNRKNGKLGGGAQDQSGNCPLCGESYNNSIAFHIRNGCDGREGNDG